MLMLAVTSATCTLTVACMLDATVNQEGSNLLVVMTVAWIGCLWFILMTIIAALV